MTNCFMPVTALELKSASVYFECHPVVCLGRKSFKLFEWNSKTILSCKKSSSGKACTENLKISVSVSYPHKFCLSLVYLKEGM